MRCWMTANELTDLTIEEITRDYQSGTLPWMKVNRPNEWGDMLTLEERVNKMALGSDTGGLKRALSEYQSLILTMVKEFKTTKRENENLLEQRVFNFQMGRPVPPGTC